MPASARLVKSDVHQGLDGEGEHSHKDEDDRFSSNAWNSGAKTSSGKTIIASDHHPIVHANNERMRKTRAVSFAFEAGKRTAHASGGVGTNGVRRQTHPEYSAQDHLDAAAHHEKDGAHDAARGHRDAAEYLKHEGKAGPSKHVKGLHLEHDLSENEKHAIRQYVHQDRYWMTGHNHAINDALRGVQYSEHHQVPKEVAQKWGDHIHSAIGKSVAKKPLTLYRGVDNDAHFTDLEPGKTVQMHGITSATPAVNTAKHYSSTANQWPRKNKNVLFHIHVPQGGHALSIDEHSRHVNEKEVLLPHGAKYHVDHVEHTNQGRIVHVTQHPPSGEIKKSEGKIVHKSGPTFGSYQDALQRLHDLSAQANAAHGDDHYAWSQYQRLFDLNHRNVEALQQMEMMRRLANPMTKSRAGSKLTTHEANAVTAWVHGWPTKNPNSNEIGALVNGHMINQHLSGKPSTASSEFERDLVEKTAGHLNSAIAKQSIPEHKVVYRGTTLHRKIKPGQVLSSPRITSHTESKEVAEDFARSAKGRRHRYVFEVHAPAGSKLLDARKHKDKRLGTNYNAEQEHTFGSHQQFKIHSVEHRDGLTHVVAHALLDHERVRRPVVRKSHAPARRMGQTRR